MAKIISYQFLSCVVNRGTNEIQRMEQIVLPVEIVCENQTQFEANYPVAKREALGGLVKVTGEFDQDAPQPDDEQNSTS